MKRYGPVIPAEDRFSRKILTGASVLIALCLTVGYIVGVRAPAYGLYHDDGIYLVTAKALASGSGYRILSLPGEIPQTKYPPLFPLALAVAWKILPNFPENLLALKLIPVLAAIGWASLMFVYLRQRLESPAIGLWIVLLAMASPWVIFFSVTILSETMFALLLTASLLILMRLCESDTESVTSVLLSSGFAAGAILTRTAGLAPLLIGGSVALALRRKFRSSAIFFAATLAPIVPWMAWSRAHNPSPSSIAAYYSGLNYSSWNLFAGFSWSQRCIVLVTNLVGSLLAPGVLLGIRGGWGVAFDLLIGASILYGFILELKNGLSCLSIFLILYEGMLLCWLWPPYRFLVPVLPFLVFFSYVGFSHFLDSLGKRTAIACGVVISVMVILGVCKQTREAALHGSFGFSPVIVDWTETQSLMRWIKENAPAGAIVEASLDPIVYLSTGHASIRGFTVRPFAAVYASDVSLPLGPTSEFIQNLLDEKVDYVARIPDPMFGTRDFSNQLVDNAVLTYPDAFTMVKQGTGSRYRIYQVDRTKLLQAVSAH